MKKILLLLYLTGSVAQAQEIRGAILGKGKPYPDKIALRWNVSNYQIFKQLTQDGVLIDRMIIGKDNQPEGSGWTRITPQPVKALALNDLKKPPFSSDTATAVVAEGLYGRSDLSKASGLVEQIRLQDIDRQNRHLMVSLYASMSKEAALAAGLGYEDPLKPEVSKGYVYRLCPAVPDGSSGKIDTGFVYVSGADLHYRPLHFGLTARSGENQVILNWPVDESPYTGYYIERSTDNKTFTPLNTQIYLPNTDPDSTLEGDHYYYYDAVDNYIRYYYRLTGLNAFGEKVMFADTVSGMGVDRTPPESPLLKMVKDKNKVTFSWSKPADPDLKGYFLLTGKTVEANAELVETKLLPSLSLTYNFTLPENFRAAYYRLMVTDTSGNVSFSNPVYVFEPKTTPPAPPAGLRGYIDTTGMAVVHWRSDTTEALRGYRVLFSNHPDHEYSAVSDLVQDTTFSWNAGLKTLTKELYVRITAVDGSFGHSRPSEPLLLERPDVVPPTKPVILHYENSISGVKLKWSDAVDADFEKFIIYRREPAADTLWKEIHTATRATEFTDKDVRPATAYEYAVRAADRSGLFSPYSFPLYLKTASGGEDQKILLTGTYDVTQKNIQLRWTGNRENVQFYILYKDKGEGLSLYKSLNASENAFSESGDRSPKGLYGLKIKYKDNSESQLYLCN